MTVQLDALRPRPRVAPGNARGVQRRCAAYDPQPVCPARMLPTAVIYSARHCRRAPVLVLRKRWIRACAMAMFASLGWSVTPRAEAFELSGGVSVGGMLIGTVPHLAVSPHASASWRRDNGFMFAAHEMCSILIPAHGEAGPGVYNQTSAAIGYAWERQSFSVGPSLSFYSMSACGATLCGRVVGLSLGGRAQVNVYFAGPFGIAVSGSLEWVGGRSLVLPGGPAATIVAGPVLRWKSEGER